jgi:hypothetical protein
LYCHEFRIGIQSNNVQQDVNTYAPSLALLGS